MAKAEGFALAKIAPPETTALAYPNHDRAYDLYGMWMTGYTEDEIASFASLDVEEVKKDLMYVNTRMSTRQIIQHNNDRERIILQRQNSEDFRKLMKEALQISATQYLDNGMTPAGVLKEYREATGMVQKAEPLIQVNTQVNNTGGTAGGAITSAEDVIRRVLGELNNAAPQEVEYIQDAEEATESDDSVPDPDED